MAKNKEKKVERQADVLLKEADIKALIKEMSVLSTDLEEIVKQGFNQELTIAKKKEVLNEVSARVKESDIVTREWLVAGVGKVYIDGMEQADDVLRKAGIETTAGKLTLETLKTVDELKPHLEAVNALISEAYLDFANGLNGTVRGTERMFNEALKRQVRSKIATGRLAGASVREITKEITETIGQQGFTVLIDRGGRKWSLKQYSEMLARTHLIKSNNEAIINRAVEFGVDIVEVSSHGATDVLCGHQEGKLYSLSGKSKNYPKLVDAPPYHPNCKHRLLLRPDLS